MNMVMSVYTERVNEIDEYFCALTELYDTQGTFETNYKFHESDFLKILKANSILMIYNLVESTVMGGILRIYEKFRVDGLRYVDVSDEIKKIWFSHKFNQSYGRESNFNTYKNNALLIIDNILNDCVIELDRKATNISGNLDADKIRILCSDHGINFSSAEGSRGGVVLKDVMDRRNSLAHGTLSFAECGREYAVDELIQIKNETFNYLGGLLTGMKEYYDNEIYLC